MEVDFNQLRLSIINNYNDLVKKATDVDRMPEDGYNQIKQSIENLRIDIAILACCYDKQAGIVSLANEKILVVPEFSESW